MSHYPDAITANEFNLVRDLQEKGGCSVKIQVPRVMSRGGLPSARYESRAARKGRSISWPHMKWAFAFHTWAHG